MKKTIRTALALVLTTLSLSAAAHSADLTRAVQVVEGTKTESYLGTQFGQTLYTFDLDKTGSSACSGECAEKWPPLLVSPAEAASLAAPLGTITRPNGLLQVTHKGRPVYTYFLDHVEGDDKGDGVGGVWNDIDFE
jgi:predicted lipoprotein with Yx(FWY)xxD motif